MPYSDVDRTVTGHLLNHTSRCIGGRSYQITVLWRDDQHYVAIRNWLVFTVNDGAVTIVQYLPNRRWVFDLSSPDSLEAAEAAIGDSVRLLIRYWLTVKLLAASTVILLTVLCLTMEIIK